LCFIELQSISSHTISQSTNNQIDTTTALNNQTVPDSTTIPTDNTSRSRKRPITHEHPGIQKRYKASSVNAAFLDMMMQLEAMLQSSSSQKVYEQCQSLMASHEHDIALFSNEYLNSLKACSFVPAIIQKLSPFFKWSDHSVLSAVVKACNNPEATMLLQQFDAQVDLSLPVTEYPVPQPVPAMAPYGTSSQTVLAVKLNSDLNQFSLQQVLELRCLILKAFQITEYSLQLMAAKSSSTILYWMIPKCVSHLISSKIMQDGSLHVGKVEEISVYPGTLFVSASNLKLGSLSFLNQVSEMVS